MLVRRNINEISHLEDRLRAELSRVSLKVTEANQRASVLRDVMFDPKCLSRRLIATVNLKPAGGQAVLSETTRRSANSIRVKGYNKDSKAFCRLILCLRGEPC